MEEETFGTEETFGQYIQKLRIAADMSKAELAKQIGVTRAYVGVIESDQQPSGDGPPNVGEEILRKLAQVLKVPEKDIFRRGYRAPAGYGLAPIEYVTDPDLPVMAEAFSGLAREDRQALTRQALALKAARQAVVGKRAE